MTSNLGAEYIREKIEQQNNAEADKVYEDIKQNVLETLKQSLRPEFLNRIDEVIVFHSLSTEDIREIVLLQFNELKETLKEKGIDVDFTDFNNEKNWKKKIYEILDSNPDIIGLSSNISNYTNTHHLANFIKTVDNNIKVIVGGPYPSCVSEKYLQNDHEIDEND